MRNILVTGGFGFVGVHLIPKLLFLSKTNSVCIIDNLSYTAVPEALNMLVNSKRICWIKADIRDVTAWEFSLNGIDCVINLAAETFVDNSINNPSPFIHTNVVGTQIVCELVKKYKVPIFIHASTDEVFGEAKGMIEFNEESPYRPKNPYAASKAAADHIVRAYGETYGFPYQILHFCNIYGSFQYPEKLIPKTIVQMLTGQTIGLYGDGQQVREWIHVEDVCDAILKALEHGKIMESYIIGSGERLTNFQIVQMIVKHLGCDESCIKYIEDRLGHDTRYAVSSLKAQRELGWCPVYCLEQGLKDVVTWYQKNTDWWSKKMDRNKI